MANVWVSMQIQEKVTIATLLQAIMLMILTSSFSFSELWRFKCPKGGYKIPTALVDPSTEYHRQHNVYVGCGKMIYCLDAQGGDLKWSTKISNAKMGQGYMTLATPWSSRLAAEAHTAFNQFPSAQQESLARQQRAAASSGG